jgi:hypothetical protein
MSFITSESRFQHAPSSSHLLTYRSSLRDSRLDTLKRMLSVMNSELRDRMGGTRTAASIRSIGSATLLWTNYPTGEGMTWDATEFAGARWGAIRGYPTDVRTSSVSRDCLALRPCIDRRTWGNSSGEPGRPARRGSSSERPASPGQAAEMDGAPRRVVTEIGRSPSRHRPLTDSEHQTLRASPGPRGPMPELQLGQLDLYRGYPDDRRRGEA